MRSEGSRSLRQGSVSNPVAGCATYLSSAIKTSRKINDWKVPDENIFLVHRYVSFKFHGYVLNWSQNVKTCNRLIPRQPEMNVEAIVNIGKTVELITKDLLVVADSFPEYIRLS